jgi:hypothetical protein
MVRHPKECLFLVGTILQAESGSSRLASIGKLPFVVGCRLFGIGDRRILLLLFFRVRACPGENQTVFEDYPFVR